MRNKTAFLGLVISWLTIFSFPLIGMFDNTNAESKPFSIIQLEKNIQDWMKQGHIPGLTLVIVMPGEIDYIKGFGYANLGKKISVTGDTLFELGSCSKSFTGLAAAQLAQLGTIDLDNAVSHYLPWFYAIYKGKKKVITLSQLLHHTSGIPWDSIRYISMGDEDNALEQTVRKLSGIELAHLPGTHYQYATVNYDIFGRIIEIVTNMSFEQYMADCIFKPLGLNSTAVGWWSIKAANLSKRAYGYKIGFFAPHLYHAPSYRGNSPAGYIISNGRDMARWLKLQLGLLRHPLTPLILKTQERDKTVPPNLLDITSYALGWQISISGNGVIYHAGMNPNYSSYIAFHPQKKIGIAILTNSNSNYTAFIGDYLMDMLRGGEMNQNFKPRGSIDSPVSIIAIILSFFILVIIAYIISIFYDLARGKRSYVPLNGKRIGKFLGMLFVMVPFVVGVYLVPFALANVPWNVMLVWSPISLQAAIILSLVTFAAAYVAYLLSSLFSQKNKYARSVPLVILLTILTGGSSAVVIFLISGSIYVKTKLIYMVYYFSLTILVAIVGRKIVQTRLTDLTFNIVYDIRMKLVEKIFYTSYQKFEKVDRGRIFATLNNDTNQVGTAANLIVTIFTSMIAIIGAFIYLSTIAFWPTIVTISVILTLTVLYYVASRKSLVYLELARDTQNVYMNQIGGMVDGFKELSMQLKKKKEYKADLEGTIREFRDKIILAMVKFINAFVIGEFMLLVVLGAVAFGLPHIFTGIETFTIMSFIMVLMYLIGPINSILNSIPSIMQLRVAWKRIHGFIKDIPSNINSRETESMHELKTPVKSIEVRGLTFVYEDENYDKSFILGPLNFHAAVGEIIFIVGGNGSGKTTLAKLLTGLYEPYAGEILIDGKPKTSNHLGEYFSAIFSDHYLFEKLYNINIEEKKKDAEKYLRILHLMNKVSIEGNSFCTIKLSGGQRKRLSLLKCYLEDSPFYLFDEVAADQDPEFRHFFYRELLARMKEKGKIVIAITHDDNYFDVADKIIKLHLGKQIPFNLAIPHWQMKLNTFSSASVNSPSSKKQQPVSI